MTKKEFCKGLEERLAVLEEEKKLREQKDADARHLNELTMAYGTLPAAKIIVSESANRVIAHSFDTQVQRTLERLH